ncbi:hypothetical protein DKX38_018924 [Salix brachista]|uniref:Sey1/RHD3-like three-helix bundle domain-containing protein n=1 Tax=Salix brachista TaxID=2182728 RepID=A0A5N5KPC8_9ROSI|nr:hypothetical protein DKX38_018924 [Salix brachista]
MLSSEIDTKLQHLREHGRNLLEMKAREAADPGRVLMRIKDKRNLDEIESDALSALILPTFWSLRILSIMATIRFNDMPDEIEKVLFSDREVPDTWEEVSPEATILLKPANSKSLWKKFRKEIKPMVTRARSRCSSAKSNSERFCGCGCGGRRGIGAAASAAVLAGIGSLMRRRQ